MKFWDDINKDLSSGNIEDWEQQAILNQEKTFRGLLGMRISIGNEKIAKLFVPDELLLLYKRMPAHTLTLSLSKGGFLQRIRRTMRKESDISARGVTGEQQGLSYKGGWSFRRKSKEGRE